KFDSYWSTAICGRFPARSTSLRCPTAKLHSVFGCGDASSGNAESVLAFSTPVSEAAYTQAADRLRHSDALNRDLVDWLREMRLQARSAIVAGVGIFGLLAPVLASLSGSERGPNERIGRLH